MGIGAVISPLAALTNRVRFGLPPRFWLAHGGSLTSGQRRQTIDHSPVPAGSAPPNDCRNGCCKGLVSGNQAGSVFSYSPGRDRASADTPRPRRPPGLCNRPCLTGARLAAPRLSTPARCSTAGSTPWPWTAACGEFAETLSGKVSDRSELVASRADGARRHPDRAEVIRYLTERADADHQQRRGCGHRRGEPVTR
jgi:hypothetical protein